MQCGTSGLTDCYEYNAVDPLQVVHFRTAPGSGVTTGGTEYKPVNYTADSPTDKSFGLASNPFYMIEDLGPELPPGAGVQHESGSTGSGGTGYTSTERHVYRITARGTGNNENSIRVLETTFAAKSD